MAMRKGKSLQSLIILPIQAASKVGLVASAASLFFAAVATSYETFARYLFNAPTKWALESTEFVPLLVVFGAAAYTLRNGRHIRVDILVSRFSPKGQKRLAVAREAFGLIFCGILIWSGFTATLNLYHRGSVSIVLGIPLFWAMALVSIGGALFALQFAIQLASLNGKTG